jgi:transcriptional regulator with XRE-family HTH domain
MGRRSSFDDQIRVGNKVFSNADIGRMCRETRTMRGDTLETVAALLATSVSGLQRIEKGQGKPKHDLTIRILKYIFGEKANIDFNVDVQPPPSLKRLLENMLRHEEPHLTNDDFKVILQVVESVLAYRRQISQLEK